MRERLKCHSLQLAKTAESTGCAALACVTKMLTSPLSLEGKKHNFVVLATVKIKKRERDSTRYVVARNAEHLIAQA